MKATIHYFSTTRDGSIDTTLYATEEELLNAVRGWMDEKLKEECGDDWREDADLGDSASDLAAILDGKAVIGTIARILFTELVDDWDYAFGDQELEIPVPPAHLPTFSPAPGTGPVHYGGTAIPPAPLNPHDPQCQSGIGHPASGIPPQ